MYYSEKFHMPKAKINSYLLDLSKAHAEEFFSVGYTKEQPEKLHFDIEKEFDESKAVEFREYENGSLDFNVYMELGITTKKRFKTVWRKETPSEKPRFITAYRVKG